MHPGAAGSSAHRADASGGVGWSGRQPARGCPQGILSCSDNTARHRTPRISPAITTGCGSSLAQNEWFGRRLVTGVDTGRAHAVRTRREKPLPLTSWCRKREVSRKLERLKVATRWLGVFPSRCERVPRQLRVICGPPSHKSTTSFEQSKARHLHAAVRPQCRVIMLSSE